MRICERRSFLFLLGLRWWSALILTECSTRGSGSFSSEFSVVESWPSSLNTYTDDFDKTVDKPEETTAINSSYDTLQGGDDFNEASVPTNPLLQVTNKPYSKPNRVPSLFSFLLLRKSRLSFCLFLFALVCGLRAAWVTQGAARTLEKVSPPEDKGAPPRSFSPLEIQQRIERVQGLLPAAQRLASTIDSGAALELLADAKESLSVSLLSPEGEKEREDNLNRALGALRGLHKIAIQQTEDLMREEEKYINNHPVLELDAWEDDVKELVGGIERVPAVKGVEPFLTSFRSVGEGIGRLTKRMKAVGVRVRRQGKFVDERDGEDPLIEAAHNLGWIRNTNEMRKKQEELLERIQESSLSVVKSYLAAERQAEIWELDEHLGYLCMRAALAREKFAPGAADNNHTGDDGILIPVKEDSSTSPVVQGRLNVIAGCIDEIVSIAGQLQVQEQALQRTSTLEDLLTANSTIMELEERAAMAIRRGTAEVEQLPYPEGILNDKEKKALQGTLKWIEDAVIAEGNSSRSVAEQADQWVEGFKEGRYEGSRFVKLQAEHVAKITEGTTRRDESTVKSVIQLVESGKFDIIHKHFRKTIGNLRSQTMGREALRAAGQGFALSGLLLEDINNLETETNRVTGHRKESKEETQKGERQFEELRRHLNGAKQKVKEALTLEEAADAAASFRAFAIAMQDLTFLLKGKQ